MLTLFELSTPTELGISTKFKERSISVSLDSAGRIQRWAGFKQVLQDCAKSTQMEKAKGILSRGSEEGKATGPK